MMDSDSVVSFNEVAIEAQKGKDDKGELSALSLEEENTLQYFTKEK